MVRLLAAGGIPWVVWGIAARVAASVTGHWLVGYFAHNRGARSFHVEGAGVQGYNVRYCGLITMGEASRFPAELGFARTVDASSTSSQFYAPRPLVNAEILKPGHPVFYGYADKTIPVKYIGGPLLTVGPPDQSAVLGQYVGGDASVLSGLMRGADEIRDRPFAIDVPGGYTGKGRVIMFANNPIYRWQNHGEFNMVFNTLMNWNDAGAAQASSSRTQTTGSAGGERGDQRGGRQ